MTVAGTATRWYICSMKNKEIEELIEQLDPTRDYGDRSYKEIVDSVRAGNINIRPGNPTPILRDVGRGITIKGTGAPLVISRTGNKRAWLTIFEERGASDIDAVYDSLIASAVGGDTKAQIYYFDRMFGKPRESRDNSNADVLASFFASFAGTRMAQVEDQNLQNNDIIIDMEAENRE